MSDKEDNTYYCSFVSIHYIICECGNTFASEEELRAHLAREHPHKRERKEYKCGVCEVIYQTEQECVDHYEKSHMEVKVEHNYAGDQEYEDLEDTKYELLENEVQEYEVDKEYEVPEFIQETYEIKSEPYVQDGGEQTELVLLDDGVSFANTEEQPRMSKLIVKPLNKPRGGNTQFKDIVCEVCGKRYSSSAALRYHQRVHTGEKPYRCHMCEKAFTMPLFLQIHIRTHTGERPYQCAICPKAFSNKAALLRHDRVHTGIKPYECPKCRKRFTQSNSMKLHVQTVHLKMPTPYKSKSRRLKAAQRQTNQPRILLLKEEDKDEDEGNLVEETVTLYEDDVAYRLVYE